MLYQTMKLKLKFVEDADVIIGTDGACSVP